MKFFLTNIDLFKTQISLSYRNDSSFSTSVGGMVSLVILMQIFVLIILFSRNFMYKLNPYIIYQEETSNEYNSISISEKNYTMAFKFMDPDTMTPWSKNLTDSLIEFKTFYASKINGSYDFIDFPLKPCEEVYPNISNYAVNAENFVGAYCPYNFSLPIFGSSDSEGDFGMLVTQIFTCLNRTNRPDIVCKSDEEIHKTINMAYFRIFYFDNILFAANYTNPLQKIVKGYWEYTDVKMFKLIAFFMNSLKIDSDVGFIFESLETEDGALFDSNLQTRSFFKSGTPRENDLPLFEIDVKATNKNIYCGRIYDKIQTVLANLGGVIEVLIIMGVLFTSYINETILKFEMCNDYYDYSKIHQSELKKVRTLKRLSTLGIKYSEEENKKKFKIKSKRESFNFDSRFLFSLRNSSPKKENIKLEEKVKKPTPFQKKFILPSMNKKVSDASNIQNNNEDKSKMSDNFNSIRISDENHHNPNVTFNYDQKIPDSLNKENLSDNKKVSQDNTQAEKLSQIESNRDLMANLPDSSEQQINNDYSKIEEDNKNQYSPEIQDENLLKQAENLSEEYELRKQNNSILTQLTTTPLEILMFTFPLCKFNEKRRKKFEILEKSYNYIMEFCDVTSFMKNQADMKLLKNFILNEDQIRLTNHIKKVPFTDKTLYSDDGEELLKIKNYYKNNQKSNNKLDKLLFENMDDDLLFVINHC